VVGASVSGSMRSAWSGEVVGGVSVFCASVDEVSVADRVQTVRIGASQGRYKVLAPRLAAGQLRERCMMEIKAMV